MNEFVKKYLIYTNEFINIYSITKIMYIDSSEAPNFIDAKNIIEVSDEQLEELNMGIQHSNNVYITDMKKKLVFEDLIHEKSVEYDKHFDKLEVSYSCIGEYKIKLLGSTIITIVVALDAVYADGKELLRFYSIHPNYVKKLKQQAKEMTYNYLNKFDSPHYFAYIENYNKYYFEILKVLIRTAESKKFKMENSQETYQKVLKSDLWNYFK